MTQISHDAGPQRRLTGDHRLVTFRFVTASDQPPGRESVCAVLAVKAGQEGQADRGIQVAEQAHLRI